MEANTAMKWNHRASVTEASSLQTHSRHSSKTVATLAVGHSPDVLRWRYMIDVATQSCVGDYLSIFPALHHAMRRGCSETMMSHATAELKALMQRLSTSRHKKMRRQNSKANSDSLFDAPDSYECSRSTEGCSKGTSHTCTIPTAPSPLCNTEYPSVSDVTLHGHSVYQKYSK